MGRDAVSDWSATRSLESAALGVLDLAMPGPKSPWSDGKLTEAVARGKVPEEVLDDKVLRVLRLADRVGAFEDSESGGWPWPTCRWAGQNPAAGCRPPSRPDWPASRCRYRACSRWTANCTTPRDPGRLPRLRGPGRRSGVPLRTRARVHDLGVPGGRRRRRGRAGEAAQHRRPSGTRGRAGVCGEAVAAGGVRHRRGRAGSRGVGGGGHRAGRRVRGAAPGTCGFAQRRARESAGLTGSSLGHCCGKAFCRSSSTRLAAIGPRPRNQVSSCTSTALPLFTTPSVVHCTELTTSVSCCLAVSP